MVFCFATTQCNAANEDKHRRVMEAEILGHCDPADNQRIMGDRRLQMTGTKRRWTPPSRSDHLRQLRHDSRPQLADSRNEVGASPAPAVRCKIIVSGVGNVGGGGGRCIAVGGREERDDVTGVTVWWLQGRWRGDIVTSIIDHSTFVTAQLEKLLLAGAH